MKIQGRGSNHHLTTIGRQTERLNSFSGGIDVLTLTPNLKISLMKKSKRSFWSIADWVNEWISTQIEQEEREVYIQVSPESKLRAIWQTFILGQWLNNAFKYSEPGNQNLKVPAQLTEQELRIGGGNEGQGILPEIWKTLKRLSRRNLAIRKEKTGGHK